MSHFEPRQLPNAYATTAMVAIGVFVVRFIMIGYVAYRATASLFAVGNETARRLPQKMGNRRQR